MPDNGTGMFSLLVYTCLLFWAVRGGEGGGGGGGGGVKVQVGRENQIFDLTTW